MAELQLKVVKNTGDGIWGKALNNFNKVLYSSGGGLFNFVINTKRNTLLKTNVGYENISRVEKESKRNAIAEKYKKAYDSYLNALEKFITDTVYTRVQKKVSTLRENRMLSDYYEINSLKGTEYNEYQYRRQMMLLAMDWENILATKSGAFVSKYQKFYVNVVDQLYQSMMRHYSVRLTNNSENKDLIFDSIYNLIENYIKSVLPFLPETEGRKKVLDGYKNYVETIDMYAKKEINSIKKSLYLLELGVSIFSYALPMPAAEECYQSIIDKARIAIPNIYITADKFEMYNILLDAIESYSYNVLSRKTLWNNDAEKEEFKVFWDKLMEYKKLERIDLTEYKKVREILFVTTEIKKLKKSDKDMKELKTYYRERMKQLGGLRKFKNSYNKMQGRWKTRRRCKAS